LCCRRVRLRIGEREKEIELWIVGLFTDIPGAAAAAAALAESVVVLCRSFCGASGGFIRSPEPAPQKRRRGKEGFEGLTTVERRRDGFWVWRNELRCRLQ